METKIRSKGEAEMPLKGTTKGLDKLEDMRTQHCCVCDEFVLLLRSRMHFSCGVLLRNAHKERGRQERLARARGAWRQLQREERGYSRRLNFFAGVLSPPPTQGQRAA